MNQNNTNLNDNKISIKNNKKLVEKFELYNFVYKKTTLAKILIFFLFLAIINITYIIILKINSSLNFYFKNYDLLKNNFGPTVIASRLEIEYLAWFSFVFNILNILLISISIPIFKLKVKNIFKIFYLISIAVLGIFMIVIEAISEYSYSQFYNLFEFLSQEENKNLFDNENILKVQDFFIEMFKGKNNNNLKFKWTTDTLTWWLAIFKIIFIILFFNIWIREANEGEKTFVEKKPKLVNVSKFKEFISKFYLNNSKNILFWLIMGTTMVFIIPLVLIVNMSIKGTPMNTMLNWTFIIRDLYFSVKTNNLNNFNDNIGSSYFAIKLLPILCSGFLVANILISTVFYIKNWKTTRKKFILEFIILLIEILVVLIVIAYSGYEGQRLAKMWNNEEILINPITLQSNYLKNTYGSWYFNGKEVPSPWMSGLKYISQTIISLSFLATIYIILGVKFKKLKI